MTERERFIKTLTLEKIGGRVPTFELEFFLTMEACGRVYASQRNFDQWGQMSVSERNLHARDLADLYVAVARRYGWSAIFLQNVGAWDRLVRVLDAVRELAGDEYFLMLHGDPTFGIPGGDAMEEFSMRMYEDADGLKREAEERLAASVRLAERLRGHGGLDGFALCADYCFNAAPFFNDEQFNEFVAPYLARVLRAYRDLGFYTIKHTDGNIMPILDALVQCGPHALHSLDPQGGVDLAAVSARVGDRVALCGNVNCGLLQTGTLAEVADDARRSLRDGMARGRGYVFCTSNCVYTGLELARYELINDLWRAEGIYR
ncbi:MAG: uroporphyrinogen decarboxylase family protein [Verrucomicrobiales bacterium]|jgi:uroporphyrinogen decarboxylase|nr:uroporphyrinogen decarboxylase family protein [Verrucomicrobiales bacterium]